MRIRYTARVALVIFAGAGLYTGLVMRLGLRIVGVPFIRQAWLLDNPGLWQLGWWLWLASLFCWMLLLIMLAWHFLPAHRVSAMIQTGLMILAAGLTISGIMAWMAVLPVAVQQENAATFMALLDALALGLIGAGLFMGGATTSWIALDLWRANSLSRRWLVLFIAAGLCAMPSPFLLPNNAYVFIAGLALWWIGCAWLAVQPRLPNPFVEWPDA